MDLSTIFGLVSGVLAIIAYGFYFRQILRSQSTPNPASWLIWLLTGLINTFTYFAITNGNFAQSLVVIVVLLSTFTIFVYSFYRGKFTKISALEIVVLLLALGIGVFWQITADNRTANLLLQCIYLISYIPTIVGVWSGRAKENPTSWIIVLIAYIFSTLSVVYGPHDDWVAFANPVVNGLIGTGSAVAAILYVKAYKK